MSYNAVNWRVCSSRVFLRYTNVASTFTSVIRFSSPLLISQAGDEGLVGAEGLLDRFRPNLVVSGAVPFEEDCWTSLVIGDLRFKVGAFDMWYWLGDVGQGEAVYLLSWSRIGQYVAGMLSVTWLVCGRCMVGMWLVTWLVCSRVWSVCGRWLVCGR